MILSIILLVKSGLKWSAEQFCGPREKILAFMVRDLKKFGKIKNIDFADNWYLRGLGLIWVLVAPFNIFAHPYLNFYIFFVPDFQDDGVEEDPLGSGDDISDEDPAELFDTENVI